MKNILLILFLMFLNRKAFSLVDYSDTPAPKTKSRRVSAPRSIKSKSVARPQVSSRSSRKSSGSSFLNMIQFNTSFKSSDVELAAGDANITTFDFDAHIQTPYNFYVDFSYALHSTDSDALSATSASQNGNPEVTLGLNWLSFGTGADVTTIDFLAGLRVAEKDSYLATSRDDKTFALETTKRFHSFILGFGYAVTMTGAPANALEKDIGNITRIYTRLGLEVSSDIRFLIEADQIKIGANSESTHGITLNQDLSYGIISPSLLLGLSPMVSMKLGGIFRTKRIEDVDSITNAKLYHLDGVYGNSLVFGLNINI